MSVAIPFRLAARPLWRGLPIPFISAIGDDGEPDFRVTDEAARKDVIHSRRCQLCGQKLGANLFFVGGPQAAEVLAYFEPAMHLDCCLYAMQTCPFIAGRREHADMLKVQEDHAGTSLRVHLDDTYSTEKSPWWVIVKARDFTLRWSTGGTLLVCPVNILAKTVPLFAEAMVAEQWATVEMALRA